jgi:DNA-binding SARP family transcriptional activator/tetratricopeptide (TPR) repeat protein
MTPAMVEIRVIGELEIRLAGTKAELPASRRARALLGWLAIHPGRHPRSRLAGLFWPDVPEASARASLRSAIWALRTALGPVFGGYLHTDRDSVTLAGADLRVDLREVRRLLADGQPAAALERCRGDILPELDDEWLDEARDDVHRVMAAALRDLSERAMAAGDQAAAVGWAQRRAALRPLDEAAGADLIKALLTAGDGPAALEAFRDLRRRLDDDLGVSVSAATAALVAALLSAAGQPGQIGVDQPPAHRPQDTWAITPSAGLAGRERELAELGAAWQRTRGGCGGSVVLAGEGGIGKTRLVEELQADVTRTAADHIVVAAATAAGLGRPAPFALWTEALSDVVTMTGPPADTPAWAGRLARIVPALGPSGDQLPATSASPSPQLERAQLCEAVVQFLGWASHQRPVLLAFEDLHHADAASLELIAYAGRRLSRMPVLFVLTRRLLPPRPDLDAVLGVLGSRGALLARIELGPLPLDAARAVVRGLADLPEEVIEEIVALAAGSPLLTTEMARAAARSGGGVASGLSGAVRQAMGMLTGQARVFIEFAAVAGRDLDRFEAGALPLRNPASAAAEALGSGLLRTGEGRTGFRHALLRDVVYDEIPDPIRARLHGELAQVLRRQGQQPDPGQRRTRGVRRGIRAAEIARHFRLAGQDQKAVSQLLQAARDARAVAAMSDAAGFLAEAAQITPHDPELLIELAEVEAFRGVQESSDRAFSQALEQTAPQDADALVSAWLRRGRWMRGGICHPRESRRSYLSALDVLDRDPAADLPARAEALAGLAWAEAVAGDPGTVDELLARADAALGTDSPGDLLGHDIGVARGHALIRAGRFTDSFGPLIAASAAASRAGRADMAYSCLSNAASAAACAGEFTRALDFADRCLSLVVPNGLLRLAVYGQVARSAILRRLGRRPEARQAAAAAAGYADQTGLPELEGLVHVEQGLLALASSDPATAATELARALELGAVVSRAATRLHLALALALAGRPEQAEAELRSVVLEPVTASDFPATLVARMSHVQGLIAAGRGDGALAERRLQESLAAWQRIAQSLDNRQAGDRYVAALIDLGRPPVSSLVEPEREVAVVRNALARIRDRRGATTTGRNKE